MSRTAQPTAAEPPNDEQRSSGASLLGRLHAVDVSVFERVAEFHAPLLDRVLPPLSEAASYSRVWIAISLVLAVGGGRRRRAAIAAMSAVAATSAIANIAMKRAWRRRRPEVVVPEDRRLVQPHSSSFPSGHAASAAAFSGVIGSEIPELWLPVTRWPASVAFSRVYTGVHYPGDVIAGWFLGRSVAVAFAAAPPPVRDRTLSRRRDTVERWVPGANARTYQRAWLRPDVIAGIVLAAILVPQGMAYAELAGVPAVFGLYATIGCLVGYAVFGPSRVLVLGPDSSVSPLIFAAIVPLAVPGDVSDARRARGHARPARRPHRDRAWGWAGSGSSPICCRARSRSAT